MEYDVRKIEAAVDQLDWSIRLFLDHQAYVPAITLAGAAEEIIGETLSDESAFSILRDRLSKKLDMDPKVVSQQHLNRTKNWLKHWKDMKDSEVLTIELETEAIGYIFRAIANLAAHDKSLSSESPRFLEWVVHNRRDLHAI